MHFSELEFRADLETERAAIVDAEEARASGVDSIAGIDAALVGASPGEHLERIHGALFGELLRKRSEGTWGFGTLFGEIVPAGLQLGRICVWPRLEIRKRVSGATSSLVERAESIVRNASAPARQALPPRLYRLRGDAGYFDAGMTRDGRCALMAAFYTGTFGIFFDAQGAFIGVERVGPDSLDDDPHPDRYGPDSSHLRAWQAKLGFEPATIEVEKFWVPEFGVGIDDMPGFYEEFLDDPESEPDPEQRKHLEADIRDWLESESFVLYWGNDLWLDGSGKVTSS